jgi:galactokinase
VRVIEAQRQHVTSFLREQHEEQNLVSCPFRLTRECMQADSEDGLRRVFGARITGGGAGGCVCIATTSGSEGESAVHEIARKYTAETRHEPTIIGGSSTGAIWFDHVLLQISKET